MTSTANVSDFDITSNSKIKTFNSKNERICNLNNCIKKHRSKGLCQKHYSRFIGGYSLNPIKEKESHGLSNSSEYGIWLAIKKRCYSKNSINYKHYGGRGIKVSDEFKNSFITF